jgi:hypothetical protein
MQISPLHVDDLVTFVVVTVVVLVVGVDVEFEVEVVVVDEVFVEVGHR